jgi:hypothetical protein
MNFVIMCLPQLAGARLKDSEDAPGKGLERIGATKRDDDQINFPVFRRRLCDHSSVSCKSIPEDDERTSGVQMLAERPETVAHHITCVPPS